MKEQESSGPADVPLELTAAQRRILMDTAWQCLARAAAAEELMAQKGLAGTEGYALVQETRAMLAEEVRQAREAWRSEQAEPEPVSITTDLTREDPVAPRPATLLPFTRTLGPMQGAVSEGAEVINLQQLLNQQGLQVLVSGRYDTSTILAVRKLQEKHGLRQRDGVVGGETRKLLNRLRLGQA